MTKHLIPSDSTLLDRLDRRAPASLVREHRDGMILYFDGHTLRNIAELQIIHPDAVTVQVQMTTYGDHRSADTMVIKNYDLRGAAVVNFAKIDSEWAQMVNVAVLSEAARPALRFARQLRDLIREQGAG